MSYVDCLRYEPWDGGKGDDPFRVFSDRLVITRKRHECIVCLGFIKKGSLIRARTELQLGARGVVRTFYFCITCCDAMSAAVDGRDPRGEAICCRTHIGMKRADARLGAKL